MRLFLIQGAPRNKKNCPNEDSKTKILVETLINSSKQKYPKVEFDYLDLSVTDDRIIRPCKGCISTSSFHCHFPCTCYGPGTASKNLSDIMHDEKVYERLKDCDAFLIFTPVNWNNSSSSLKLMFDRLVCANLTLTKEQALKILGEGNLKNAKITSEVEQSKQFETEKINHLEGKVCGFFVHGDAGANDYKNRPLPASMKGYEEPFISPIYFIQNLISQCRYSGIFVPENLIKGLIMGKDLPYSVNNDLFEYNFDFFQEAENLIAETISYLKSHVS